MNFEDTIRYISPYIQYIIAIIFSFASLKQSSKGNDERAKYLILLAMFMMLMAIYGEIGRTSLEISNTRLDIVKTSAEIIRAISKN